MATKTTIDNYNKIAKYRLIENKSKEFSLIISRERLMYVSRGMLKSGHRFIKQAGKHYG